MLQPIAAATPVLNAEEIDTGQLLRALAAIDTVTQALSDTRHALTEARP